VQPTEHSAHHIDRRVLNPAIVAPRRLQRSRRAGAVTPSGALYVGSPTLWGNPFSHRSRIGHARSVILHGSWLAGELTPYILSRAGFGEHEILALDRLRERVCARLHHIVGLNLECWCPLTSPWCHADTLLRVANRPVRIF
jgi:hypothetical protein